MAKKDPYVPFEKQVEEMTAKQLQKKKEENDKTIEECMDSHNRGMGPGWLHVANARKKQNELIKKKMET